MLQLRDVQKAANFCRDPWTWKNRPSCRGKDRLLFGLISKKRRAVSGLVWASSLSRWSGRQPSSPVCSSSCFWQTCLWQDMDQKMWRENNQHERNLPEWPHPLVTSPEQNCHPSLSHGHYLLVLLSLYGSVGIFQLDRNTVPEDLLGAELDPFSNQNYLRWAD